MRTEALASKDTSHTNQPKRFGLLPSLLSAVVTILVIYELAPNFVTLTKVTNPVARFDADTTAWHATI